MLLKFSPDVEHLKCVTLTHIDGVNLQRTMIHLLPGVNEVTDDEFKAMRPNITNELERGEIIILAQKVGDGRGKPGGRKAKNLIDMPVNIAVRYVSECNNGDTLIKWYKEITKEEVRLAITKRMKTLGIEEPTDEIPEAPNASPMSLDEFDEDENNLFNDIDEEESDSLDENDNEKKSDSTNEDSEIDYSEYGIKELREMCSELGIETKGMKKEDLIATLKNNSEEVEE